MLWSKLAIIGSCLLLLADVKARRMGRPHGHGLKRTNLMPLQRSMDELDEPPPEPTEKTKLVLLKPNQSNDVGAGRTLKHFLLVKSLLGNNNNGGGSGYGGGYGGGYMVPYIIVNNPTNLTNVNNNSITNEQPTTTSTTGTTTGTGGTGAADAGGAVRVNYFNNGQPQQSPMPMQMQMPMQMPQQMSLQMPMPTEVYQQRESNTNRMPFNVMMPAGMISMNGGFIPLTVPTNNNHRRRTNQRRRNNKKKTNNNNNYNPFAAFANNFKRLQFL